MEPYTFTYVCRLIAAELYWILHPINISEPADNELEEKRYFIPSTLISHLEEKRYFIPSTLVSQMEDSEKPRAATGN